ncbi:MAG: hypothetical protein K2X38_04490 [Gemmataceae bacterium]|nr:hypothetical protein [Gemmataceae bacterium]
MSAFAISIAHVNQPGQGLNVNFADLKLPNLLPVVHPEAASPEADEHRLMEIGKEWILDLEQDRTTKLYNSMSPEFRKKMPRDMFEMMIHDAS